MARSIALIRQGLIDALVSAASTVGLTIIPSNWSKTDYKLLTMDTIASAVGIEEQSWDAFTSDIDSQVALAAPETSKWWQNQMLNVFQFDPANPQVVGIFPPNFQPSYPTPDPRLNIIKFCSIVFISFGRIQIKAAAMVGGLPADIDTTYGAGTLDTVRSFARTISDATINKVVQSGLADKIMLDITFYYDGLYAAVIKNNTKAAINKYFNTRTASNPTGIPFDGLFDLTDLSQVIKGIAGMKSFIFNNINARADGTGFVVGVYNMVLSRTELTNNFQLIAGYCQAENTAGYTFDDTFTFIPE